MENLEFESVNNFRIAKESVDSVIAPINTVNGTSVNTTYNRNTINSNYNTSYNSASNTLSSSKKVEDIISPADEFIQNDETVSTIKTYDSVANLATTNFMWMGTILLSFVIWIICTVSLILNCVRKNVGKAIFSGIGLIVPLLSIFISTLGRVFVQGEELVGIGMFLVILAIIIEIVVGIMAFIFCFSKNKNKTPNE